MYAFFLFLSFLHIFLYNEPTKVLKLRVKAIKYSPVAFLTSFFVFSYNMKYEFSQIYY